MRWCNQKLAVKRTVVRKTPVPTEAQNQLKIIAHARAILERGSRPTTVVEARIIAAAARALHERGSRPYTRDEARIITAYARIQLEYEYIPPISKSEGRLIHARALAMIERWKKEGWEPK